MCRGTTHFASLLTIKSLVRANQKDSYVESLLLEKIQTVVRQLKGSRVAHTYMSELDAAAKFLYLTFTTVLGSRTLGEEYTDLFYTNSDGSGIPSHMRRAGFVAIAAGTPLAVLRLGPRFKSLLQRWLGDSQSGSKGWIKWALDNLPGIQTMLSIHYAVFYFTGAYYQLSKRIWGMRYSFGHREETQQGRIGYEVIGTLLLSQIAFAGISKLRRMVWPDEEGAGDSPEGQLKRVLLEPSTSTNISKETTAHIDLSDSNVLAYIPEPSRSCVLCMSVMTDPAATVCGHIFCWTCICEWCREKVS